MRTHLVQASLTLVLLAGAGAASAQAPLSPAQAPPSATEAQQAPTQSPQSLPKEPQNSSGHQAQQTESGRAGKDEPSSHATKDSTPDANAVFVNGALNVPGAPQYTDTVPAKFSEQNAADDKLITVAYTLKILPDEQRNAVFQALKAGQPVSASSLQADIGTELPASIELSAIPEDLAAQVPLVDGYRYTVSDGRVVIVSPATRIVVGVLPADDAATVGAGQRSQ